MKKGSVFTSALVPISLKWKENPIQRALLNVSRNFVLVWSFSWIFKYNGWESHNGFKSGIKEAVKEYNCAFCNIFTDIKTFKENMF